MANQPKGAFYYLEIALWVYMCIYIPIIHLHQFLVVVPADPERALTWLWPLWIWIGVLAMVKGPLDWVISDLTYTASFPKYKCMGIAFILANLKAFIDFAEHDVSQMDTDLNLRVAVVTGGTSGIGWQLTKELVKRGCTVVIGSSSMAKCRAGMSEVMHREGQITCLDLDLFDLASVAKFSEQANARHNSIDYLFNNAGGIFESDVTAQGYEVHLGLHFGHHLLQMSLLGALTRPNKALPHLDSRVITTTSQALWAAGPIHPSVYDEEHEGEGDLRGEYLQGCRLPLSGINIKNRRFCTFVAPFTGFPWTYGRAKFWSFAASQRFAYLESKGLLETWVSRWKTKASSTERHVISVACSPGTVGSAITMLPPPLSRPAGSGANVLLFGALSPDIQGGDMVDEHHHIHQVRPGTTYEGYSLPSLIYRLLVGSFASEDAALLEARIWKISAQKVQPFL